MSQSKNGSGSSTGSAGGSALRRTRQAVQETAREARGRLGEVASTLSTADISTAEIKERLEDLSASTRRYGERVKEQAARAGETARETYEARSEKFRQSYSKLQDNVDRYSDDLGSFVNENPGRAVLIAVIAGFLFGLLFRRSDG